MNKNLWLIVFISLLLTTHCLAKVSQAVEEGNVSKNKLLTIPLVSNLSINKHFDALLELLKQADINEQEIEKHLSQLTSPETALNAAEQYLLLVSKALLKEKTTDQASKSRGVIELLTRAHELSEQISEQQLTQPKFLQLHLILAVHYARVGKFELAYLENKSYLKKYYVYRKNKRVDMIDSLEKSFEVADKKASNALLENQNNLKVRTVASVQQQQATQQFNLILIMSAAFVFVLLLIRQLKIRNKLIRLTRTDALTGLANRSVLFEQGQQLVKNFAEQPTEFSVLLLDLDHFKRINDNFGHQVGDSVLVKVAELVGETMRSRDVFSRLGGEEFVALLPFADSNKAKAIAMHINKKLALYDFSSLMMQGKVTVSIGVATMENNEMSFDDLLHGADLAMYQAKEQGRNAVICYQNIAMAQERRRNTKRIN